MPKFLSDDIAWASFWMDGGSFWILVALECHPIQPIFSSLNNLYPSLKMCP